MIFSNLTDTIINVKNLTLNADAVTHLSSNLTTQPAASNTFGDYLFLIPVAVAVIVYLLTKYFQEKEKRDAKIQSRLEITNKLIDEIYAPMTHYADKLSEQIEDIDLSHGMTPDSDVRMFLYNISRWLYYRRKHIRLNGGFYFLQHKESEKLLVTLSEAIYENFKEEIGKQEALFIRDDEKEIREFVKNCLKIELSKTAKIDIKDKEIEVINEKDKLYIYTNFKKETVLQIVDFLEKVGSFKTPHEFHQIFEKYNINAKPWDFKKEGKDRIPFEYSECNNIPCPDEILLKLFFYKIKKFMNYENEKFKWLGTSFDTYGKLLTHEVLSIHNYWYEGGKNVKRIEREVLYDKIENEIEKLEEDNLIEYKTWIKRLNEDIEYLSKILSEIKETQERDLIKKVPNIKIDEMPILIRIPKHYEEGRGIIGFEKENVFIQGPGVIGYEIKLKKLKNKISELEHIRSETYKYLYSFYPNITISSNNRDSEKSAEKILNKWLYEEVYLPKISRVFSRIFIYPINSFLRLIMPTTLTFVGFVSALYISYPIISQNNFNYDAEFTIRLILAVFLILFAIQNIIKLFNWTWNQDWKEKEYRTLLSFCGTFLLISLIAFIGHLISNLDSVEKYMRISLILFAIVIFYTAYRLRGILTKLKIIFQNYF